MLIRTLCFRTVSTRATTTRTTRPSPTSGRSSADSASRTRRNSSVSKAVSFKGVPGSDEELDFRGLFRDIYLMD